MGKRPWNLSARRIGLACKIAHPASPNAPECFREYLEARFPLCDRPATLPKPKIRATNMEPEDLDIQSIIAGLFAAGYLLSGSQIATKGALGLATAARNIGAALVPAFPEFLRLEDHADGCLLHDRNAAHARSYRSLAAAEGAASHGRPVNPQGVPGGLLQGADIRRS
jgi:hypothetical protein